MLAHLNTPIAWSLRKATGESTYFRLTFPECRFYPAKVKLIIEDVISRNVADKEYDQQMAKTWVETIVRQIQTQTKGLSIPAYKIVVQAVIGQVAGQGVRVASKCLWDEANDNYSTFTFTNHSLFCTGMVFGIYQE